MKMTRIREFLAAVFVMILVIVLAAGIAAAMGKRVPILSSITDLLGL